MKKEMLLEDNNFIREIEHGTSIITGPTSGLGRQLALELASFGGNFILAARDTSRANTLLEEMRKIAEEADKTIEVQHMYCNLCSLSSVSYFCKEILKKLESGEIPEIRLLVLNAGIKPSGKKRKSTWEGFEKTFQVNFLSQAFIYLHLRESLRSCQFSSKVIFIGSKSGHSGPFCSENMTDHEELMRKIAKPMYLQEYNPDKTYATSKLCCLMFANNIYENEQSNGITACTVNPGQILSTKLRRNQVVNGLVGKVVRVLDNGTDSGTAPILQCCLTNFDQLRGRFYDNYEYKRLPLIGENTLKFSCFVDRLFRIYNKFEIDIFNRKEEEEEQENNKDDLLRRLFETLNADYIDF